MREKTLQRVITFFTTADALETELVLSEEGYSGRLIPVPRNLSAGCGLAWKMTAEEYNKIPMAIIKKLPECEQSVEMIM